MSYKIAVASSDGSLIDETFGSAKVFHIFEVTGDGSYSKVETRAVEFTGVEAQVENSPEKEQRDCGDSSGCGNGGCHGAGGGCAGGGENSPKVELVSDCRCVVCKKIGFQIQKQFERRAITAFDVSCPIGEALDKISSYFQRVDTHQSLRGIAKK